MVTKKIDADPAHNGPPDCQSNSQNWAHAGSISTGGITNQALQILFILSPPLKYEASDLLTEFRCEFLRSGSAAPSRRRPLHHASFPVLGETRAIGLLFSLSRVDSKHCRIHVTLNSGLKLCQPTVNLYAHLF